MAKSRRGLKPDRQPFSWPVDRVYRTQRRRDRTRVAGAGTPSIRVAGFVRSEQRPCDRGSGGADAQGFTIPAEDESGE